MADEKNTDCFLLLVIKYFRNNQNLSSLFPLREIMLFTLPLIKKKNTYIFLEHFGCDHLMTSVVRIK